MSFFFFFFLFKLREREREGIVVVVVDATGAAAVNSSRERSVIRQCPGRRNTNFGLMAGLEESKSLIAAVARLPVCSSSSSSYLVSDNDVAANNSIAAAPFSHRYSFLFFSLSFIFHSLLHSLSLLQWNIKSNSLSLCLSPFSAAAADPGLIAAVQFQSCLSKNNPLGST